MARIPNNGERVMDSGDEDVFAEFYKNSADDLDHIRLKFPGDKRHEPDFIAGPHYQKRFPRQWEAYQAQKEQTAGQTPLTAVPWIDEAARYELMATHVHSLEQLAAVHDGNLDNMMIGARALRDRARTEVENITKAGLFDEQAAEVDALKARLAALEGPAKGKQAKAA